MDVHHETLIINNDYEVHDFTEDPNFDQFINLIRGENNNGDDAMFLNYGSDIIINDCLLDDTQNHQLLLHQIDEIHQSNNSEVMMNNVYGDDPNNPTTLISSFSCFDEGVVNNRENEEGEYSSATTTATDEANTLLSVKPRLKTDRSKTLISERRRRSRMKEKLYALRALVPNITKMDKASIIGDAVSYVHELQAQAKKLKGEVAGLEASLFVSENYKASFDDNPIKTVQVTHNSHPIINKKIVQIEMVQVEERGYYVKIVCNKGGGGIAASLYRALESLVGFSVRNSNMETVCDTILLTFTLNVKAFEPEVNLPNLKLWVTGALLNQGFEFMPNFHS
ncbi:hypothetical protein PIB30_021337 [Stylosanthes scabra]|uniref:BHLH domain-containing protein n=1 Tax=Stylosanthes scabra TaxID=79078 RepID=A0ABU6Q9B5_9FABA|nr:hypothetical protein [Stylosanthes scabra]